MDQADVVEGMAAIAYAHSFSAGTSREGWERVKDRAEAGGQYAAAIVERCYRQAVDMLDFLVEATGSSLTQ